MRTFALMCSKVQKMLMDKDAGGECLLMTVARHGRLADFTAMLTCLKEHLTSEQVRKVLP